MSQKPEFAFGDDAVARNYDDLLVPVLFDPWARKLVDRLQPLNGRYVLDLATGTGIVASHLVRSVGEEGRVVGADINGEMLDLARDRCEGSGAVFMQCGAGELTCPDTSQDLVVCQQGFQFFPDRGQSAREMFRVLRPGGRAVVSTWRPVTECRFFGAVCEALEAIGEDGLAEKMRVPFDYMPSLDLLAHFDAAGFERVELERHDMLLVLEGGFDEAVRLAYATPIGPELRALAQPQQEEFRQSLVASLSAISPDGRAMGNMASDVLFATKAR